jgi:hypothetical protein
MKILFIGLLTLVSVSTMASVECYVNNQAGDHIELNQKELLDTGAPFGIVRVMKANGRYHFSSIVNGEETIVSFKKELSLVKQSPMGISVNGDAALGNIVCK